MSGSDTIARVAPLEIASGADAPAVQRETVFDVRNLSVRYG
jgi:hypothetical protein